MAGDAVVHDVDLPSLEYDDEETAAYMATETPSFDVDDDAMVGSTFVIVDEDVSDPDDDDNDECEANDVAPLVNGGPTVRTTPQDARQSSAGRRPNKFLDRIKEHKGYQRLARIVKKKGRSTITAVAFLEVFRKSVKVKKSRDSHSSSRG